MSVRDILVVTLFKLLPPEGRSEAIKCLCKLGRTLTEGIDRRQLHTVFEFSQIVFGSRLTHVLGID